MGAFNKWYKQPWLVKKSTTQQILNPKIGANWLTAFGGSTTSDIEIAKLYESLADVFAITNWVTDRIANIPTKIVNSTGKDTTNKDLERLKRQPNPYQNWPELTKLAFTNYEILGGLYQHRIIPEGFKQPSEIHVLPTAATGIIFEGKQELPSWLNTIVGYKVTIGNVEYTIPASEVLHKRYPNLRYENGQWAYGISKYIPANMITRDLKAIYESRTSIIEDRHALGIISNESEMPNVDATQKVQDKLRESYGLRLGQRKFIMTGEKLKYTQIGLGIAELQLIENAAYDFNKLAQVNGFDPVIFSTDGSTFANKKEAEKSFVRSVLVPRVNDYYTDFNEWNSPLFNGDMIVPDWSKVAELVEDNSVLSKQLMDEIRHGAVTPQFAHINLYGETDNMPKDEYVMLRNLAPEIIKDDTDGN